MKLNNNSKSQINRLIKFGIVGVSGVLVNMAILWLFTETLGIYYLISSILAIFLAMLNNFFWNNRWTWSDRRKPGIPALLIRLLKFCFVSSLAAYIGNLGILWSLTHYLGIYYLIANMFGIAVGTTLNFTVNHVWTFRVQP